jgi:hypothetical protein
MELIHIIQLILSEQISSLRPIPVDIKITNGNIMTRSFHIIEFDSHKNIIRGLTLREEYAYTKEERDPVFGYFSVNEIKELYCEYLNLHYSKDSFSTFSSGNYQ